jgi:hypothetical protein
MVAMTEGDPRPTKRRPSRLRSALKFTCLGAMLTVCGACGLLAVALQNGPVEWGLPGGNTLRIGSEDFVLSDYSFKQGTTHSFDLDGNGVRTILQLQYLEESRTWELVLHQASRERISDHKLFSWQVP